MADTPTAPNGQPVVMVLSTDLLAMQADLKEIKDLLKQQNVEKTFNIKQVCDILKISRGTFYNYVTKNILAATRKPQTRQWIVTNTALNDFISRSKA